MVFLLIESLADCRNIMIARSIVLTFRAMAAILIML